MSKLAAKNATIMVLTELLSKFLEFTGVIFIARALGVEKYGLLSYVYSIAALVSIIPHFGFDNLVTRDLARNKEETGEYLVQILFVKLLLSVAAIIALIIWMNYLTQFNLAKKTLLIIGSSSTILSTTILFTSAILRSQKKASLEALSRICLAILMMTVAITIGVTSKNLLHLLVLRTGAGLVILMLSIALIWKYLRPDFHGCANNILKNAFSFLKKGWPFGILFLFTLIHVSIDVVMLNFMVGDLATGYYAAAGKIYSVLLLVPTGISNAVFPFLSEGIKNDFKGFIGLYKKSFRYLLIFAILSVLITALLGNIIIYVVFGEQYQLSAGILFAISWAMIPAFLNPLLGFVMLTANKEKLVILFSGIGAILNILLNSILIPRYSFYGAAIATIFTEGIIFLLYYLYIKKKLVRGHVSHVRDLLLVVIGLLLIVPIKYFLGGVPFLGLLVGLGIYIFVLLKFHYIDIREARDLLISLVKP